MSVFDLLISGFKQMEAHDQRVHKIYLSASTFCAVKKEEKFNEEFKEKNNCLGTMRGAGFYYNYSDTIEFRSNSRIIIISSCIKIDNQKKFKFIQEAE